MNNQMFCYQCQETARGTGCTMVGVCGKKPDVAGMQDLLLYVTKGLSPHILLSAILSLIAFMTSAGSMPCTAQASSKDSV